MSTVLEDLGQLDPDDPRQASLQIAAKLRAAILTKRVEPGEKLPSQPELAAHFGVARETVKRALETLRQERLTVSRQGAGVFVRAQTQLPVELRPHLEAAFRGADVAIDFTGFSAETLRDSLAEVLDKVRAGDYAPDSISIRLIVADPHRPSAIPARADTDEDDPSVRARMARITRRSVESLTDQVSELGDLGLVKSVSIRARAVATMPVLKMFIINRTEVFTGFYYPDERTVTIKGNAVQIYDAMGKDVPLIHFTTQEETPGAATAFVDSALNWFESTWRTVARDYPEDDE